MGRVRGRWGRLAASVVLASVLMLVAASCSKSSNTMPLTKIFVQKFRYHGVPATLKSGINELLFQNEESFPITHEMIPIALPSGKTTQDVIDDAKAKGADSEDDWLHIGGDFGSVDTGAGIVEILNLPPGNYAVACWQTGTQSGGENGPTHVSIGMIAGFTVT